MFLLWEEFWAAAGSKSPPHAATGSGGELALPWTPSSRDMVVAAPVSLL